MPDEIFDIEVNTSKVVKYNVASPEEIRRELHSERVQEIVSSKPDFIIQWGNMFFLSLLLIIILACWLIKYPDIITTEARLTSINAPKAVISLTSGKLIKLHSVENERVNKGQILGFMESTANPDEILKLSSNIDSIETLMTINGMEKIHFYFRERYAQLGELQSSYQIFSQSFFSFSNYVANGFYVSKKAILDKDMINLKQLRVNLIEQKKLQQQDLQLTQKTFDANESLKNDNVISDFDYRVEQSKLISKKMTLPQLSSAIINNENQQNEKQKEILELDNAIIQQRSLFQQALYTFKYQIEEWKRKYLLTAPITGKVAFASSIQENQQLQTDQIICYIQPEDTQYFAEVVIPQANFGKASIGQDVLLKFSSFPFQEYGFIEGKIEFISQIPMDSGYFAKVALVKGLETSTHRRIQYHEGLLARAEIITEDMRLLERFYNGMTGALKSR